MVQEKNRAVAYNHELIAPGELKIRPLRIDDYKALINLWNRAELSYRPEGRDSPEEFTRQVHLDHVLYLGAFMNCEMVGSILATHDGRRGWLNRLAVAPQHRRNGIAARLVERAEKELRTMGMRIITVLIEDWNQASFAFFKSQDYVRHDDVTYFSKREGPEI